MFSCKIYKYNLTPAWIDHCKNSRSCLQDVTSGPYLRGHEVLSRTRQFTLLK